jgi:hypothetical protein
VTLKITFVTSAFAGMLERSNFKSARRFSKGGEAISPSPPLTTVKLVGTVVLGDPARISDAATGFKTAVSAHAAVKDIVSQAKMKNLLFIKSFGKPCSYQRTC